MKHEECLREFGIFNLEKINRNMIGIFKEESFVSLIIQRQIDLKDK